ncbi:MAG TPA: peptidyl-prolyl cis-trans isomerase [Solirubrobacterales bacterium]|nr:peptidyl-prolyl cis-trans isomerase [Solirubrobacterales bacterium]
MGAKPGQTGRKAGRQRLALIVFGAIFVLLFIGFAIAQGIGRESVPSGDVALVEDVPDGTVSEAEYKLAVVQQVAQLGLKKTPKEGSTKFEEVQSGALGELLDFIWIRGEAEELDLSATPKEIEEELNKIKETNFPTAKAFNEFLETSKFTQEDVEKRVELQVLSTKIQEAITAKSGEPSESEVQDFYDAAKATQFTTKPTRDIRIIINKDKAEVEAAKTALEADDSDASWKKVAAKYSSDPTTKSKGGLQPGLSEEVLATAGPLKAAVFESATNELVGPIKYQGNYTLIEVVKLNAEKVQTLEEAKSQIATQLQQQKQEAFFEAFVANYQSKWEARTICASGFEIEKCSNYKGTGHPSGADPACYEADPKVPASECPAPVVQPKPAMPGSVTILIPKGKQLIQRPRSYCEVEPDKKGKLPAGCPSAETEALPEGVAPGE